MAMPAKAGGIRFRPSSKAILLAGMAFLILIGLGTWQVERLRWKTELIETRQTRSQMAPIPLPSAIEDPVKLEFRPVMATGVFLHEKELYLGARSLKGNLGYHILTPLLRPEGAVVLVNRGWVPLDQKLAETRPQGQLEGAVTVEGILRLPGEPGWFTPDNVPEENFWYWVDLPAMEAATGLALAPVVLEAGPEPNPGNLPIGGQTRLELPNDHLQYAITWYALALALAVVFVLYHRRQA